MNRSGQWIQQKLKKAGKKLKIHRSRKKKLTLIPGKAIIFPPKSDFPFDVLKFIKRNANPRQEFKLIKVCKYFYQSDFQLTVTNEIWSYVGKKEWTLHFLNGEIKHDQRIPKYLWITDNLVLQHDRNIIPEIVSKIAFCQIKDLCFTNQIMSLNEYKILTDFGAVKWMIFRDTFVINKGIEVSFEEILKTLPKIFFLSFYKGCAPPYSSHATIKLPETLKYLTMDYIPATFNLEATQCFMQDCLENYPKIDLTITSSSLENNLTLHNFVKRKS